MKLFNLLAPQMTTFLISSLRLQINVKAALKCEQRRKVIVFRLITKFLQGTCSHLAHKNAVFYFKLDVVEPSMYQTADQALGMSQHTRHGHCSEGPL